MRSVTKFIPDISGCDREPIHIPGAVQPHGIMLVVEIGSLIVRHCGGDVEALLPGVSCIGRHLGEVVGEDIALKAALVAPTVRTGVFVGTITTTAKAGLNATAHVSGEYLVVEIEPKISSPLSSEDLLGKLEVAFGALDDAGSLKAVCDVAAIEFRKLTGYDRVMVYQFQESGAGAVLSEDKRPELHSYLNHHFPGSDIPQQARALYVRNVMRVIPDRSESVV